MTVCIGAVCEGGKVAVVAADRMVTFGPPMMLTTEPPAFSKIQRLTDASVLLFSGSVPDGEWILTQARAVAAANPGQPIATIAEAVRKAYVQLKRTRVEETILGPFIGADFDRFQQLIAQSPSSQLLQGVLALVTQHNLQTDLLVAGTDNAGTHVFVVQHPGILLPMASMGFAAIGSGAVHASVRLSLGQHTPTASLIDTVYNVYEAKRAAEVAPGVGKMTDMTILTGTRICPASEEVFKVLDEVHKERPSPTSTETARLKEACDVCLK